MSEFIAMFSKITQSSPSAQDRSVLIPQDTLGHPRTPQDVKICII